MSKADQKKKLIKLFEKWGRVQGELKEAEQINQLAVIPAINELRYAGRVLVAVLAYNSLDINIGNEIDDFELSGKTFEEAITIADQYITNAEHDISDALIYFFQKRADEINGRFGATSVFERYPEYEEFINQLKNARTLIISSRSNIDNRYKNYKEIKKITRFLISSYYVLDKSDTFMSIEIERLSNKTDYFRNISLVSTFSSILFFILLIYNYSSSL